MSKGGLLFHYGFGIDIQDLDMLMSKPVLAAPVGQLVIQEVDNRLAIRFLDKWLAVACIMDWRGRSHLHRLHDRPLCRFILPSLERIVGFFLIQV